jgi:hypothetical protein
MRFTPTQSDGNSASISRSSLLPIARYVHHQSQASNDSSSQTKRISIPPTLGISAVLVLVIAPRAAVPASALHSQGRRRRQPFELSQPSSPQRTTWPTKRISLPPTLGISAVPVLGMVARIEFLAHALHPDTERHQQQIQVWELSSTCHALTAISKPSGERHH